MSQTLCANSFSNVENYSCDKIFYADHDSHMPVVMCESLATVFGVRARVKSGIVHDS
jgi:hypothetical protein